MAYIFFYKWQSRIISNARLRVGAGVPGLGSSEIRRIRLRGTASFLLNRNAADSRNPPRPVSGAREGCAAGTLSMLLRLGTQCRCRCLDPYPVIILVLQSYCIEGLRLCRSLPNTRRLDLCGHLQTANEMEGEHAGEHVGVPVHSPFIYFQEGISRHIERWGGGCGTIETLRKVLSLPS